VSEAASREQLVNAIKARALFYWAFYKEFSAELGPDKTREVMKRAIYQRGRELGERFAPFAPADFAGLSQAFLDGVPDPEGTFNPRLVSCSAAGLDLELRSCPLRDAWREAGLSDGEIEIMTDIAGAVDAGTFEGAGFAFAPDTWKPGRSGCCHLHIRPRGGPNPI
jgi:hypothetical protein